MTILPTRILVTDDEPLSLKAMEHLLRSNGYEVYTATTGAETLRQVQALHPDMLLLDVVLPDIAGTELCRRIKADPANAGIFIILLSGIRTGSDEQAQGMEGGADGYVVRPIANRELLARMQAYLRIKTAEQALKRYSEQLEETVAERTHALQEAQEKNLRQERLAILGQMAGSVGHELRNPLGVIAGAVYYLKLVQPDASEKVHEYLGKIEQQVHVADKIIGDLLGFARVTSVERQPQAVPDLLQRVFERFPVPAPITITLNLPAGLPKVCIDPGQIEQVLGNLTTNACQAMPADGTLTITAGVDGAMLAVAVQDTGAGIPPENLPKLFEPLFTTKSTGIGLGLAVSKKLAEANGGRIEVHSQPGQGSTFTLYLPITEAS